MEYKNKEEVDQIIPVMPILVEAVCDLYKVSQSQLFSPYKTKKITHARWIVFYIMKFEMKLSYPEIGLIFNKDHSTIIHGVQKITDELKINSRLETEIHILRNTIRGSKGAKLYTHEHKIIKWMNKKGFNLEHIPERTHTILTTIDLLLANEGYKLSVTEIKK